MKANVKSLTDPYYSGEAFAQRNPPKGRPAIGKSSKIASRRIREQILRDMGLVKVRGALGGTYWE